MRKEIFCGDKSVFAVKIVFYSDLDDGAMSLPEESAAWGSFQIWVDGKNLCLHAVKEEEEDGVSWYLLSLVNWLKDISSTQDWNKESLIFCREGGIFPGVTFLKYEDLVEIEWKKSDIPGIPEGFQFKHSEGSYSVDSGIFYKVVKEVAKSASDYLKLA
jgi:hypothetical protein